MNSLKTWFMGWFPEWVNGVVTEYPIKRKHILIAICTIAVLLIAYKAKAHEVKPTPVPETKTVVVNNKVHDSSNKFYYGLVGGAAIGAGVTYYWSGKKDEKIKVGVEARKPE